MAAVLAAIAAAFLAGAVALFREHRLQQRRLLVAARVMHNLFGTTTRRLKSDGPASSNAPSGDPSFASAWDSYREDLAGHLTWSEWQTIEEGVNSYLDVQGQADIPQPMLDASRATLNAGIDALYPYCTQRLSVWRLLQRNLIGQK